MKKNVKDTLCSVLVVSATAVLFFLLGMSATHLLGRDNWVTTKVVYVTESTKTTTTVATTLPTSADGKLNINLATKEELMTIKGIGETLADSIIQYRNQFGPFTSLEQLMEIDGIAEGRYNQWAPFLTIG